MKYNLKDLLTTSEASVYLGRSVDTLYRWHKTGKLIPKVIDIRGGKGTRLYPKSQLDKFKKENIELLSQWNKK